jgi:hypothetical protein
MDMKLIIRFFVPVIFIFILSCNTNTELKDETEIIKSEHRTEVYTQNDEIDTPGDTTQIMQQVQPGNRGVSSAVIPSSNQDWDKKIIRNAEIVLEISNYDSFYSGLRSHISSLGGYIAQEEQTQSDYKLETSMKIKVPVHQFDNAISQLIASAKSIQTKTISSQDVSAELIDTRSRLEARRHVRQRYLDLLAQAKNMEEILNVQSRISEVQEEIESAAGRIKFLGHSASYSTISITFYHVLNQEKIKPENPTFGSRVKEAFNTGGSWIVDLFVGLVSVWPIWIFLIMVIYIARRWPRMKENKTT